MKNHKLLIIIFTFIFLYGCRTQQVQSKQEVNGNIPLREYSIQAVLWQQNAAEYRALAYQAFNLAQLQLDNIIANNKEPKKPLAIVTDIDETLLDNSPYSGKQIELDEEYTSLRWAEWVKLKKAEAIPGALQFFNYAKSKGVEVFYISNRSVKQKNETIENLVLKGFPFADNAHVLLKDETSGKEPRRLLVQENFEIVLLIGDNLSDFSETFENSSTAVRNNKVDSLKSIFGTTFIVLPNPMYGDWETKGIMEGKYDWTNFQKDSLRVKKIKTY
ncbi:5'-nucleotidase, lipoprotein e(P4) family [Aureibaculum algae]|uniref:5'-nucleotidase, lipoprotein e(P4) family n=1 Tax=Aureibaculum algae TaxID=2584122 RepID=A0A5B7TV87_9FLAO|nr:5'-nucleotidase, lipoprotein e(P4) family [Aureibaculum algae]QCX38552.1 5'-nucleotidase, lipoprotein e(P4) family [Aureibaculum algae]